ncbi:acyl-CoA dehydrogenase family protein [Metabacillus idriensis]|uniref:acyl-CoA dehydrogenase family protein n=1 Tax=Metabacillus idriensis TaxID=324768 RepID=UPI0008AA33F7|nr:acyl-CoA dehydrogenase family protein [Metabacillus idriensis]MCM3597638.1 acyl-CoA dehydrogenase family protein [Metabacillus idriensis]OHR65718.1 isovaleryl-CoA dehydrogenase [Bacillus sp. HMSC76G11]
MQDANLLFNLKKFMDDELYEYTVQKLAEFQKLCFEKFDQRAAHTDREGQPKLIRYDKFGNDVSEVWLNEGYKKTIADTYETGIVGYLHKNIPELNRKANYHYSYALGYLLSQVESGFYCPVTLTMATAYLIDEYGDEELKAKFLPHVISTGDVELYEGATFLTERQGGSDVGANETKAVRNVSGYRLYGEKYFASNAGACKVAAVLARIEGAPAGTKGLSLFLVPWKKEDGTSNQIHIRRLKDKLGVRAVPSAEVELNGAEASLIGDPSRGFYYMMEALNLSRICNAIASAGIMRRAYIEAKGYADQRTAFGKRLTESPMIQETLCKMAVRQEIQTSACFELIQLFEKVMREKESTDEEKVLTRLFIALLKAKTAEEAIEFSHEAIEMHGGNGYIEDFVTPRLLRDSQVLTVWEGTANILGLEVLRLIQKHDVHLTFLGWMRKNSCGSSAVNKGIRELEDLLAFLEKQKEEGWNVHAKKLSVLMCDLLLSAIALKDAHTGDQRKQAIADVWLEDCWNKSYKDEKMLAIKYYDLIVESKGSALNAYI